MEAAGDAENSNGNKRIDLQCDEWWKLQPQQKQNLG